MNKVFLNLGLKSFMIMALEVTNQNFFLVLQTLMEKIKWQES